MLKHYALNLTRWSASLCAHFMGGGAIARLIRQSRVNALLSGINVILAKAGIYTPVSDGLMDTRLRGHDDRKVSKFKPGNSGLEI